MKKLVLMLAFVAAAAFAAPQAHAQIMAGVGGQYGAPQGDLDDAEVDGGFGGYIYGKYFVSEMIAVGLEVNYSAFENSDIDFTANGIGFLVTGDYYFMPSDSPFRVYAGAVVGITSVTTELDLDLFGTTTTVDDTSSETTFGGRVGAVYMFSESIGAELQAGYITADGYDFIPVRLGLTFAFGN